jgi:regulator of sirC expression with transglutaminase-like and TPR domain
MAEPDVLEGALLIARVEYPDLDPAALPARLDELAEQARPLVGGRTGREGAQRLLEAYCGPLGFRGNREDYGDPRNSYLNDVVERRTGIPISLCWIFVELARRLGFRAHGVGFPGHFLARTGQGDRALILDCFHGRVLDLDGCRELFGPAAPNRPIEAYLAPAAPREVLLRMVGNLRRIHEERGDFDRVLRWIELQADFGGRRPELDRDQGLVELALGRYASAARRLEDYLRADPRATDADAVRSQLSLCRRLLAETN